MCTYTSVTAIKVKLHVFEYLVNGRQHKWVTPSDGEK